MLISTYDNQKWADLVWLTGFIVQASEEQKIFMINRGFLMIYFLPFVAHSLNLEHLFSCLFTIEFMLR